MTADLMPLEVTDLQLTVKRRRLLKGVSFQVELPGITVIMGPNGAGKSLLLRCMHGLIEATSGSVSWGGTSMSPEIRKRQAMVFQRPVLLRRTVAANVRFVQKTRGRPDEGVLAALLGQVHLSELAEQPARKLSGGEQQRLALARALATRPDVLFLDEPTASLDPASTRIIEDLVSEVSQRGVKVIFVTHDVHQAKRLAGDLVFLADGELLEHRLAQDFFSAPQSPQAEAYLSGRLPEL